MDISELFTEDSNVTGTMGPHSEVGETRRMQDVRSISSRTEYKTLEEFGSKNGGCTHYQCL